MFLLKIQNTRVLKIYDKTVRVAMVLAGGAYAPLRHDEGLVPRTSREMDEARED